MSQAILMLAALLAGVVVAVQVGVNVELRNALGDPITATFLSFVAGALALLVYAIVTRSAWPAPSLLAQVPLWKWAGGLLGAFYVVSTILIGPRIGAAALVSLVVTGQMIAALLLDRYGVLGFEQHAINGWRIAGALFVVGGTFLILRN